MNILDENIPESQRQLLRSWGIRVRQLVSTFQPVDKTVTRFY
jgi:hypothetical protein